MGKASAKAKQAKGKIKETAGDAMGDRRMQTEGIAEQAGGKTEEVVSKAADKTKKARGKH
ncbi:CsbD family protein [Streptomyces sp. NPDC047014]|uniref:CsbD family protein n=1 Tax=Streptomyces sp. NPDC047014 TaxID=3155736 RepID=UPI0033ED2342